MVRATGECCPYKLHKADVLDITRLGAGGSCRLSFFCYLIPAVRRLGQERGGMEEKGGGKATKREERG